MQRKKVSTGTNNAAAVLELDDDEQLIEEVTTTKKIGRQRRTPPPAAEEIITIEPDDDDEEDAEQTAEFSQTSLAALIYGEGETPIDSQYCTVAIRRNPDSMNDKFLTPCGALTNLPPLRNIELTAEKMDIEEHVRNESGGGHYFFQLHFGGQMRSSWRATLSDPPAEIARVRAEQTAALHPTPAAIVAAPAAEPVDPMSSFMASLRQTRELKDLLFGDTEKQLRDEIQRLKDEAARVVPPPPAEPKSEKLSMLEMALTTTKPEVTDRVLNSIFPSEEEGSRHWIADIISVAMENKETIIGLAGSLFGGAPQPAAAAPSIADMMRQPAPAALPERKPVFNRQKAPDPAPAETPPPAPPAESEPDADLHAAMLASEPTLAKDWKLDDDLSKGDETAIDAEITSEVKDAKPKRGRRAAA